MNIKLTPAVRNLSQRYRTQADSIRRNSHEFHDLRSLSQRLLLSPAETLEQVSAGNLVSLDHRNGKHMFSSRALDILRNRVVDFITVQIVEELSARGVDEERVCMALERAFRKQHDLSRGNADNVLEFAQTPADDDDFYGNAKKTAGQVAGAAAAAGAGYLGYKAYQGLKNNGNGPDNGITGQGNKPQLPPSPSPSGDSQGARHPGPPGSTSASLSAPVTTASSTTRKTLGDKVIDPLTSAVQRGKSALVQRGSSIWQALRSVPLD